ncbi:MAG: gamma-glutamyltransferase [Pseudonocardia sp.]|nr:gamma-glutamyltransferase [Pseudonocardia sp.]
MAQVPALAEESGPRAFGNRAVVTAATAWSADIGARMLRRGGTVYDAAVAAALAETVLLPPKCGLAGDLVALVLRAGQAPPEALVAVGPAPRRLGAALRGRSLAATGGLSVGIPGAPAGYRALAALGVVPLAELAAPAIALARQGFPWPAISADLTALSADLLREQNPDGTVYLPDGVPPAEGTATFLPGLAEVLERFVADPERPFSGDLGDAVYEAVRSRGGVLERDELDTAESRWSSAASLPDDRGLTFWATPPPTHGPSLLDAVDGMRAGLGQAELVERVEAAVARRAASGADTGAGGGTSVVSAADQAGNAIVLVHSNSFQRYGSGIVVEPYGLVLSNRPGRGFTGVPGHPNFPAPGRRPVTTLHVWAARLDDGSILTGATPGGENQMRWNAQTLAGIRAGERDPGALVAAPRWGRFGGRLMVEEGFASDEVAALEASDDVELVPRHSLRSAQQVLHLRRPDGSLVAGADPRTGAAARAV